MERHVSYFREALMVKMIEGGIMMPSRVSRFPSCGSGFKLNLDLDRIPILVSRPGVRIGCLQKTNAGVGSNKKTATSFS